MTKIDPVTGGYVLEHATKRDAFEVVTDVNRPFVDGNNEPVPVSTLHVCPTCQVKHQHKTYHIMVNSEGRAVVSPGVFRGLQHANAFSSDGLHVKSHTDNPPNQILGTQGGMMGLVQQRTEPVTIYHTER